MKVLHDMPWAQFGEVSPNELALDQKHPSLVPSEGRDTVKLRLGSWAGMFGWISGDRLTGDERNPTRREKWGLKLGETAGDGGLLELHLQRPNTTEDRDMIPVLRLTTEYAEILVPFRQAPPAGPPPKVTRFFTDHGRFCVNWQDDTGTPAGIVYDTKGAPDETQWTAVGRVRIDPL